MRFLAKDDDQPAWAWHLAHGTGGPRERRAALHAAHEYMATDTRILGREYAEARTAHRIGERLRPCLGCAECLIYDEAAMYDDLGSACDGSGVIPALNLSVSAYLSHHSGLPVDFQFQRVSDANAEHGERPRSALGVERRSL